MLLTTAKHQLACEKCHRTVWKGENIHYIPPAKRRKRRRTKPGKPKRDRPRGRVFCRRCVAKLHRLRFPPPPDGKVSAWLRTQEFEMVERELAKTTRSVTRARAA
jgi:hypothetical protein